jgi:hypothetical protein
MASVALVACSIDSRDVGVAEPRLLPDASGQSDGGTGCTPGRKMSVAE